MSFSRDKKLVMSAWEIAFVMVLTVTAADMSMMSKLQQEVDTFAQEVDTFAQELADRVKQPSKTH